MGKKKEITKEMLKRFIKVRLSTNYKWATRALVRIYDLQTPDEQSSEQTHHHNNIGFSGCDAEILSSFAKQHLRGWVLSSKQCGILYRKIQKYSSQIIKIGDTEKLYTLAKEYYKNIGFQEKAK